MQWSKIKSLSFNYNFNYFSDKNLTSQNTTNAKPSSGRRKRQAQKAPPGTTTGTVLPEVTDDFSISAIFLKKYMELDDDDRYAIGHRLVWY